MKRQASKLSLSAMLGLLAGMNDLPVPTPKEPDRSRRDSNRMPLDADETKYLSTLSGKNKKIYVKKLREKYKK